MAVYAVICMTNVYVLLYQFYVPTAL